MGKFVVWCPELGAAGPEDGREMEAIDAEGAAKSWARQEDVRSAEYWIVGGGGTSVVVRDELGVETGFRVHGEQSIDYFARQERQER